MNTGDALRDARGTTWQVGTLLGRGTWARTFAVRSDAGAEGVIKAPLTAAELGGDARLAAACREIALEQARLAGEDGLPGLAPLLARVELGDGRTAPVFARRGHSWTDWLASAPGTASQLRVAGAAVARLSEMGDAMPIHGNLKPGNLLVDERGAVWLSDPATPTLRRHQAALHAAAGSGDRIWRAPELRVQASPLPLSVASDTYAIAAMLLQGLWGDPGRLSTLPDGALDKAARVALQDRITNRLKGEPANPRFHARLAERLGSLLNRALSRETSPSPPYRFRDLAELQRRLDEAAALLQPGVSNAGRILFDLKAGAEAFSTEDEVSFTCSIACSAGVESHDEIACGVALFDSESGERIRQARFSYTVDRHQSGRYRFRFKSEPLHPQSYRVRLAFTIRDSGHQPTTAEGVFQVRAAPGYVPPRPAPAPARPLPMEREAPTQVTESGAARAAPARATPVDPPKAVDDEGPTTMISATPIAPAARPLAHRADGPRGDGPRPEAPRAEPPRAEPPRAEPPRAEAPRAEPPRAEPPRAETPRPEPDSPRPGPAERPAPTRLPAQPRVAERPSLQRPPLHEHPSQRLFGDAPAADRASAAGGPPTARPTSPERAAPDDRPSSPGRPGPRPGIAAALIDADRPSVDRPSGNRTLADRPGAQPPRSPLRAPEPARPPIDPAADLPDEPGFSGAGRWSELPLPRAARELTTAEVEEADTRPSVVQDEEPGPIGQLIARLIALVRGDAYIVFIGGATLVIGVLALLLYLLKQS